MSRKIACVGSRSINPDLEKFMEDVGAYLVENDFYIASGNATGSDQAYQRGGNRVDPTKVTLYLPWRSYNKEAIHPDNVLIVEPEKHWYEDAQMYHPGWYKLSQGSRRLMARNVGIWEKSAQGIAYPSDKLGGGGTGHGMRYAIANSIRIRNLSTPDDYNYVWKQIYGE